MANKVARISKTRERKNYVLKFSIDVFSLYALFCMVEKTVEEIPKNRRVATIWPRERIHFPRTFFSYRNEIVHFFVFSSMAKFHFFLFSQKNKQTFLFTQENW